MSNAAEKISITLTPEMNRMIKDRVEAGKYGSSSELIRDALRLWQRREEEHEQNLAAIRARIQASLDDPRPSLSVEEARASFLAHVSSQKSEAK